MLAGDAMPFFRIIAFNHIIARDDCRWKAGYRVQVPDREIGAFVL